MTSSEQEENEQKAQKLIGQAIIDNLLRIGPGGTIGTIGTVRDYDQTGGEYHQSTPGSHHQGGGTYYQGSAQ